MLKQFIVGTAALAASVVPFSGVASAETTGDEQGDQAGLANVHDLDLLHDVNLNIGACDNDINVLIAQILVEDVLNGVAIPIASPGSNEAWGAAPDNCATGSISDGGTIQGD